MTQQNLATSSTEALAAGGPACPPHLEATARLPVADGPEPVEEEENRCEHGGCWGCRGGSHRRRGLFGEVAHATAPSAAASSAASNSRRRQADGDAGAAAAAGRACTAAISAAPRARRSRCWPGRATSRTARPTRPSTGSPTSRRERLQGRIQSSGRPTRLSRCSRPTRSSSTSSRPRVMPACGSSAAASSSP